MSGDNPQPPVSGCVALRRIFCSSSRTYKWVVSAVVLATLAFLSIRVRAQSSFKQGADWAQYGGSPENTHFSPLTQINRSHVHQLQIAWSFDTGETGGLETTPIVVNGILYAYTPSQKVIALDAGTGKLLWKFDSKIRST